MVPTARRGTCLMATSILADDCRTLGAQRLQFAAASHWLSASDASVRFVGSRIDWMANRAGSKIASGFFGGGVGESSSRGGPDSEKVRENGQKWPLNSRLFREIGPRCVSRLPERVVYTSNSASDLGCSRTLTHPSSQRNREPHGHGYHTTSNT